MSLVFSGIISGSLDMSGSVTLAATHPLPTGYSGMLAVSESAVGIGRLYFHNGYTWQQIAFEP